MIERKKKNFKRKKKDVANSKVSLIASQTSKMELFLKIVNG